MARARRVCSTPGCPTLVEQGHCLEHARPNAHARGYDGRHRKLRAEWVPRVAAGQVICWRCGERIASTDEWDLGHDDGDRSITRGPEHRRQCNRSAAGRASHERH